MPTYERIFTDRAWYLVCHDATAIMIEGAGPDIQFGFGSTDPTVNGFDLETGRPKHIRDLTSLSGCVWVRSTTGKGAVRAFHDSTTVLPFIVPDYFVDDTYVQP